MEVTGKLFPAEKACSRCGSHTVDALARQGLVDGFLNIFHFRPYHCRRCYRKFYLIEPSRTRRHSLSQTRAYRP